MKLGILTYHYSINEGAMLQAYALQKICQFLPNIQVEMVNYESFNVKKRDFLNCFKQQSAKSIVAQLRRIQTLSHFKEKSFTFNGKRLVGDNYENSIQFVNAQKYDGLIVGSDEVWKIVLSKKNSRRFPNIYWLDNKLEAQKFSYAASANKTDYKNIPKKYQDFVQNSFESYSLIGVRDHFTKMMVANFLPATDKIVKVADPTLLIERFEPQNIDDKLQKRGFDFHKSTVVLNLENEEISRTVASFFKARGWQIVAVTAYSPYADINFVDILDPLEWVTLISRCQFSVTRRFHGTIFSILSKVPFLAIEKDFKLEYFKTSKLQNLLEDLQLQDNMFIYKEKDFSEESLHKKIEYVLENTEFSHIDEILQGYRQQGLEYLQRVGNALSFS